MQVDSFILDSMRWSHSRVGSYHMCAHMWYLTYILKKPTTDNFYGQYGNYCHDILEKYFRGELELYDLSSEYEKGYDDYVTITPPPLPKNAGEIYKQQGKNYFDGFDGMPDVAKPLEIEGEIEFRKEGKLFTGFLDLLYESKEGELVLADHKSSNIYKRFRGNDILNEQKLEEYKNQMYLYSQYVFEKYGKHPDRLRINAFRFSEVFDYKFKESEKNKAFGEIFKTIDSIYAEDKWLPSPDGFKCSFLCGVKDNCEFCINFGKGGY